MALERSAALLALGANKVLTHQSLHAELSGPFRKFRIAALRIADRGFATFACDNQRFRKPLVSYRGFRGCLAFPGGRFRSDVCLRARALIMHAKADTNFRKFCLLRSEVSQAFRVPGCPWRVVAFSSAVL